MERKGYALKDLLREARLVDGVFALFVAVRFWSELTALNLGIGLYLTQNKQVRFDRGNFVP